MPLPRTAERSQMAPHPLLRWVPRSRRSWRRVATVSAAALTANMAYHVIFGQNGITSFEHKRAETQQLAVEQRRLAQENEYLREHVTRLQNDPGAIEHQAREELHYTRPGEVIYTLSTEPKAAAK